MNRLWELTLKIFFNSPDEALHLLPDALVVNDAEDMLLSSILHLSEREYSPGSISIQFFFSSE